MAPIKFEENIKERLEKRTIQPSVKSWATLSQRIDNEEKKSTKKGFWWLGIAASVIGILLVSNFFLNIEISNNNNSIIVEDNTTKDTLKIETPKQIINTPKQNVIVENKKNTIKSKIKKTDKKPIEATKHIVNNTNVVVNNSLEPLVNKTKTKKPLIINNNTIKEKNLIVFDENKIKNSEVKNGIVTDNEINTLLAKATEDIAIQKTKTATIPIDYNGLLLDVEDELDETFRDKMFKKIKKGYKTVKESVAERNN